MPIKITRTTDSTAPKFFTGKPNDFALQEKEGAATISATLSTDGKTYALRTTPTEKFTAAGLREIGEHFVELAGIMDGSIKISAKKAA